MATYKYEGGGPGLHVPSRNTGRGDYRCGKPKSKKLVSTGKPTSAQRTNVREARGPKWPGVTEMKLETGRSSPGQSEVRRKPGGGSKGC